MPIFSSLKGSLLGKPNILMQIFVLPWGMHKCVQLLTQISLPSNTGLFYLFGVFFCFLFFFFGFQKLTKDFPEFYSGYFPPLIPPPSPHPLTLFW